MKNSSIHILVIEDDPQIRNFISYVLKQEEFLCTAVGTAQAGMSELVSGQIDLMILDLGLPDYDGIEVIQKVREWSDSYCGGVCERPRSGKSSSAGQRSR